MVGADDALRVDFWTDVCGILYSCIYAKTKVLDTQVAVMPVSMMARRSGVEMVGDGRLCTRRGRLHFSCIVRNCITLLGKEMN